MQKFNSLERLMLLIGYKPSLILNFLGFIFCQLFLWKHQLIPALAAHLIFFVAGIAVAWKKDLQNISVTITGKMMLAQASPLNLIICITGLLAFYYGIWLDNYIVIGAGAIVIFAISQWAIKKAKNGPGAKI